MGRRVAAGLPESASPTGRKTTPTGGARLSAAEGRGRRSGPKEESGLVEGRSLGRGRRKKEREREVGWAGRAENKGRKKKRLCIFETKSNNSIQTQIQRIQI